jgi:hypothetical protein
MARLSPLSPEGGGRELQGCSAGIEIRPAEFWNFWQLPAELLMLARVGQAHVKSNCRTLKAIRQIMTLAVYDGNGGQ